MWIRHQTLKKNWLLILINVELNVETRQCQVSDSSLLWCVGHKGMCVLSCVTGFFSKEDNFGVTKETNFVCVD